MKKIITERVEYEGECPGCHQRQVNDDPKKVDIICWSCKYRANKDKYREECRNEFVGATIGEVIVGGAAYDLQVTVLCIKLTDGTFRMLTPELSSDDGLCIKSTWLSEDDFDRYKSGELYD